MKSILFAFSAIIIAATATINVNAQYALSDSSDYYINPCPGRDYKDPCSETVYEDQSNKKMEQGSHQSKDSYPRALKSFRREFSGITNEYWFKTPDGFIASFKADAVQTEVVYNKKGTFYHTISYYGEKNLPADVRENVKSSYYTYDILSVAEVHMDHQTIYVVYLQNKKFSKTVRVWNGDIEEVQNFERG